MANGEFDAIVLAAAGLHRAGMFDDKTMIPLPIDAMIPSPGQGALAIQARRGDVQTLRCLTPLHDPETADCVAVERQVVFGLNGDCHSPIAAYAEPTAEGVRLLAALGAADGGQPVRRVSFTGPRADRSLAKHAVAELLAGVGGVV